MVHDVFTGLEAMFGRRGVEAVLDRALRAVRRARPVLAAVSLEGARLVLPPASAPGPGPARELALAVLELFLAALEVASTLVGWDLVEPVVIGARRGKREGAES